MSKINIHEMRFFSIINVITGTILAKVTSFGVNKTAVHTITTEHETTDFDRALLRHESIYASVKPIEDCYDYSVADMPISDAELTLYEPILMLRI